MPIINVNLIDTFDQWRVKTNTISNSFGDLSLLTTTENSNVVSAVNELKGIVDGVVNSNTELVEDTSPELGGDLDLNSKNIIGTGNINITGTVTGTINLGGGLTGTVDNAQVATDSITTNKLADDAVSTSKLFNNAVTEIKIADGAVTGTKIDLTGNAQGDIMFYNGTSWVRLAKGTAGQTLKMNAGATAPEWVT